MHIADGVLDAPIIAAGWVACGAGVFAATRKLEEDELARVAVMTSAFFVASFLHIRFGPETAHLSLPALMGIVLGHRVFVAVAIATFLQALLTAHGGLTTIGVTTTVLGVPALLSSWAFSMSWVQKSTRTQVAAATVLAVVSVLLAVVLQGLAFIGSGREYWTLATVKAAFLLPLTAVEALVTGPVVFFLARVKPTLLRPGRSPSREKEADAS